MIYQNHHQQQQQQPQQQQQQTTSIRRRRRSNLNLPPLGLRNLGNTCYLNSVLQCLTYTPPLANFSLLSQHSSICSITSNCAFCILEKRIARSLTLETASVDSPNKIYNCIRLFSEHFRCNRQEDAHEFLRYVIDACHNACLRISKLSSSSNVGGAGSGKATRTVVQEMFGGELRSQVKCVLCGGESNKVDEIMDISLDLFQSSSVKDALQKFFQPEVLNGTNKYKCEKCDKLVVAKKQMSILNAPNVLVIQLKRFEGIHGGKIDRAIAFEECLVLSNYMCKESQDPHPEYTLIGTIVHSGFSQESGHYYAYVKDSIGRWYRCNDSFVSLSTLQQVLSEKSSSPVTNGVKISSQVTNGVKSSSPVTNGVKSPDCNGYDDPNPREVIQLKATTTRLNGPHNSEKVTTLAISKNGKVPLTPIKFGNLKSIDLKKLQGKGNGTSNVYVENHIDLKEVKDTERIMEERPQVTKVKGATVNGSIDVLDPETEKNVQAPHGNGKLVGSSVKVMKTEKSEDGRLDNIVTKGRKLDSGIVSRNEEPSTSSGLKRKVLEDEIKYSMLPDGDQLMVDKIKETLAKDASSHLRSCGWYDEVYSFIHAKKKLCVQTAGNTTNDVELKKLLIGEAKQTFLSQIPASLKLHLCDCLK